MDVYLVTDLPTLSADLQQKAREAKRDESQIHTSASRLETNLGVM